jgi:hypothetical protein
MPDDFTVLPHTGLRVPHTRLRVSSLKTLPTPDGEAFTATLRLQGRIVGWIDNDGRGGPTGFRTNGTSFGWRDLQAYVATCRTAAGRAPSEDTVLDDLVEEYRCQRRVASADRTGHTALRLCEAFNGDVLHVGMATAARITTDAQRQQLIAELAGTPITHREWWQLWTGTAWQDLTARPAAPTDEATTS